MPCCEEQESNTSPCNSVPAHLGATFGGSPGSIYTERGEFFQKVTDLTIPGRPGALGMLDYVFRRHYRSRIDRDGPLGHNWDHNYFEHLTVQGDGSVVHDNGLDREDLYRKDHAGRLIAPPELFTEIIQNRDRSFTLRYRGGTQKHFGADGKLLQISDRNDNRITFHYDAQGQLIRVNDTLGRDVLYRYLPSGRLSEIEDFIGRKVRFTYDGLGDLVAVTSPAVTGTPNDNDFPNGKTTRYTYSAGFADARLNHNLLTITAPNEVAADGPPVVKNEYGTSPLAPDFDRVQRQTYGGTNASGIPAGGIFSYAYTLKPGASADDPVLRTRETDRNGNVEEYEYNSLGYPIIRHEFTRGLRPGDPPVYETSWEYNPDGLLLKITYPEGNRIEYTYDTSNPNRLAQGNLLIVERIPDADRGGDQATLITSYTYEPRFNQIESITDPRGNDPSFVPPNGGSTTLERYTTVFTFDYDVAGDPDLNPEGFEHGNIVRKQEPTVTLPDGSSQPIISEYLYNRFGQRIRETDPEGNVDEFFYFPEKDPDGDEDTSPGTRAGLASDTGGYLKERITDSTTSPRRTESASPDKISNRWFYDPVGNLIRAIDGRGNDTLYAVNQLNQVVRERSEAPFRYIKDTLYDFNDNVVRIGIENRVASASDGKPVFTSGGNFKAQAGTPSFFVHRSTYDILNNLVQKDEDATGSTPKRLITRYRYDPNENRLRETLPAGNLFSATYDERDLVQSQTRGLGSPEASTMAYNYDDNRNPISVLDGEDNNGDGQADETRREYDGFERQILTIDAVGNRTTQNHDPNGNVVMVSNFGRVGGPSPTNNSGAGNVLLSQRESKHDELNRLFQQDDLLFISAGVALVRGPVLTEGPLTAGDGRVSLRTVHDRNSRKVRATQDDLDTATWEHDGVDRVVRTVDPEGNAIAYGYDKNNNVVRVTETELSQKLRVAPEAFTTTRHYDTLDRLTRVTDNCGNTHRSAYDSRNNLTHATDAKASSTTGCPRTVNAQGNSMRYTFDGMNRRLQEIRDLRVGGVGAGALDTSNPANPDGRIVTRSNWDANSRLLSQTDDNGNRARYSYDALNRLIEEGFADGTTKQYRYDRDDNLIQHVDNRDNARDCRHDAINRRMRCDITRAPGVVGTTAVTYQYDGLSRSTRATDNNLPASATDDSVVTQAYDSLNRTIEEVQNGKAITGDWFGAERRVGLTYPNDRRIDVGFDRLDRIKTIQDAESTEAIVQYDYLGPGRVLERRYPNGVRLTYLDEAGTTDIGYDGVKRMIAHRHLRANDSLVVGFSHGYDRAHNKGFEEKLHDPTNSELYAYDSPYRITGFERGQLTPARDGIVNPQRTQEWQLDGVGNWRVNTVNGAPEDRTVNEMNEYLSIAATPLTHDDNGNLTDDGALRFAWDYQNRLRTVTRSGAVIARYTYDALGRRIQKVVTNSGAQNGTTRFYLDGWQEIEERNGTDTLTQQYVYGGVYIDEPLVLDRNRDGDGSAIGAADQRLFYHQNTLYSVFALTDTTGTIVEGYQYDAYGRVTPGGRSAVGNPYLFTGRRLDGEIGLYYYRTRYLDPGAGRFTARDIIGIWGDTLNLGNGYAYVGNNPANRSDWTGLQWGPPGPQHPHPPPDTSKPEGQIEAGVLLGILGVAGGSPLLLAPGIIITVYGTYRVAEEFWDTVYYDPPSGGGGGGSPPSGGGGGGSIMCCFRYRCHGNWVMGQCHEPGVYHSRPWAEWSRPVWEEEHTSPCNRPMEHLVVGGNPGDLLYRFCELRRDVPPRPGSCANPGARLNEGTEREERNR